MFRQCRCRASAVLFIASNPAKRRDLRLTISPVAPPQSVRVIADDGGCVTHRLGLRLYDYGLTGTPTETRAKYRSN